MAFFRHSSGHPFTYSDLLNEQALAFSRRLEGASPDGLSPSLLLAEVAPVVTLGRRTPESDVFYSKERFAELGIEVLKVDRGGLATSHGPGQWVLFPVARLSDSKAVRAFVEEGLERILSVVREYVPEARIRGAGEWGVFGPRGKIAACGLRVQGDRIAHGFAVNGYATPRSFVGIRGCGLDVAPQFVLEGVSASDRPRAFDRLGEKLQTAWMAQAPSKSLDNSLILP